MNIIKQMINIKQDTNISHYTIFTNIIVIFQYSYVNNYSDSKRYAVILNNISSKLIINDFKSRIKITPIIISKNDKIYNISRENMIEAWNRL